MCEASVQACAGGRGNRRAPPQLPPRETGYPKSGWGVWTEPGEADARFLHGYKGVELLVEGLAPQPVVPVVDGFSCRLCRLLTISRSVVRKHANREHSKQGEEDERIFAQVRLQSW